MMTYTSPTATSYVRTHANKLIARYESGEDWQSIARSIGLSAPSSVTAILRRMGKQWHRPTKRDFIDRHAEEIIARHNAGETWVTLAKEFGVYNAACLTTHLEELGYTWKKSRRGGYHREKSPLPKSARPLPYDDEDFTEEFIMKISPAQRMLFWKLFQEACYVRCIHQTERDEYRHNLLEQACGKRSMKEINSTTEFDAVLLAVARAACNMEMVDKLVEARSKRWARAIIINVRIITGANDITLEVLLNYLSGILSQKSGREIHLRVVNDWYLDLTESTLAFLLKATSIAARRKVAKSSQ